MDLIPQYTNTPVITTAFFILTRQCNLRCTYCYEDHCDESMSIEVAEDAVSFLFDNAEVSGDSVHITFFGGEPTLKPDLIESIIDKSIWESKVRHIAVDFGMVTNCTIFPKRFPDIFKKLNSPIGVQLSIDGPKEIQNMYRVLRAGSGSWDLVNSNIDTWKQLHTDNLAHVSVHSCVNKSTVNRIYDIFQYFRVERNIEQVWILPVPEVDWTTEDVATYKTEMLKIYSWVTKAKDYIKEIHNFAPFDKCFRGGKRGKPCGAGLNFATVLCNGDLDACHQLGLHKDTQPIGNIYEGVDDNKRRIYLEYEDSDIGCGECPHQTCYRCIASNFDNYGILFRPHQANYCDLMLVDHEIQAKLKLFMENKHGSN